MLYVGVECAFRRKGMQGFRWCMLVRKSLFVGGGLIRVLRWLLYCIYLFDYVYFFVICKYTILEYHLPIAYESFSVEYILSALMNNTTVWTLYYFVCEFCLASCCRRIESAMQQGGIEMWELFEVWIVSLVPIVC